MGERWKTILENITNYNLLRVFNKLGETKLRKWVDSIE